MAKKQADITKKEMDHVEDVIGRVMQVGVILSAIVIVLGVLMLFITGKSGYPAGVHPDTFAAIGKGILAFKPYAIIMLGLFLLILTPALRVLVSIYAFWEMHDSMYVWITTLVMVILIIAMVIGSAGI
ncbi:DUF1634 domain-containing protein [Limosilactobacillus secaliphilus]|uniref:Integral membrane protein n=1 Tax=Limosilactobacillus secaliphilus TaxID=396268 RepID=A0A0R2IAC8_9LACO|nr:DUF1634 domain-containing protein [Limosilactobacillus secaliphilus]KRN58884.1 integral membrane protein [Limosilactobacillus secaliphilus]